MPPIRNIASGVIDGAAGAPLGIAGASFVKLGVGSYLVVVSQPG